MDLRQAAAQECRAGRDRYELLSSHWIRHRRGCHRHVRATVPQCFPFALVDCDESAVGGAIEYKAPGRRQHAGPGFQNYLSGLRNFPSHFAGIDIDGAHVPLARLGGLNRSLLAADCWISWRASSVIT